MGKIWELDELHAGTRYSAAGCEFNVNESTIYIKQGVFKQTHTLIHDNVTKRLKGNEPFISPRSNGSIFANSVFAVTLQNTTSVNNDN